MNGDSFNIAGSVSGSNVGGHGNTVVNRDVSFAVDERVGQLISDARAEAMTLPENVEGRDELLDEIDGLESDLRPDADKKAIETRLGRLETLGQSLSILATIAKLVDAVRGWLG